MAELMYVVISGGDGYSAQIVRDSELDDVVLTLLCGEAIPLDASGRNLVLASMHDVERWACYDPDGPARYREDYEDGYLEIIRLTMALPWSDCA